MSTGFYRGGDKGPLSVVKIGMEYDRNGLRLAR